VKGKWFGLKFEDAGESSLDELKAAIAFSNAIVKGERKAEAPIAGGESKEDIPF
jgi:hypothetical protein